MKKHLYILMMLGSWQCHEGMPPEGITGMYTRYQVNGTGKEWDTLVIQHVDASHYIIERHWRYVRQVDGVLLPPLYRIRKDAASWESQKGELYNRRSGKFYFLQSGGRQLGDGVVTYQKTEP